MPIIAKLNAIIAACEQETELNPLSKLLDLQDGMIDLHQQIRLLGMYLDTPDAHTEQGYIIEGSRRAVATIMEMMGE